MLAMALIPQESHEPSRNPRVWLIPLVTVLAVGINTAAAVVGAQAEQGSTPTLVDPAGYAFSIWGLIFLANLVFAGYQALPSQREDKLLDRVAAPYVAGQVFAALFAVAALIEITALAQATTLLYFAAAVATYVVLGVGVRDEGWTRRLAAWFPASLSAAWLFAASIVVVAAIVQNGLELAPPVGDGEAWAAVAIGFAVLVTTAVLMARRDFAFAAVVAWALIAIGQEQINEVVDASVIAAVAVIGLVALGSVPKPTVPFPWRRRRQQGVRAH